MYALKAPSTPREWESYHAIRRRVLWENRKELGAYDQHHPDEHRPGNFPLLLMLESDAIGVVRVDIEDERATLRRVAIREDMQRRGHGAHLLRLAEEFARDRGCRHLYSHEAPDAVTFYEKSGFRRDPNASPADAHVPMQKWL